MSNNKQSSLDFFIVGMTKLMAKYENEAFREDRVMELYNKSKAIHRKEHGQTWDDSLDNLKARGMNEMRAYTDFDDYYNETFGGNNG